MPDTEKHDSSFYPRAINACYDDGASGMRWCRIANVNETIEIKSLLSLGPKKFYVANDIAHRAVLSGNSSLITTFSS